MEISLWGQKCVYLKGKSVKILLDPRKEDLEKDVKLVFFEKHEDNYLGLDTGEKVVIWGPGEYEVSGVEVYCGRIGSGLFAIMQLDEVKIGWISTDKIELSDKKKERLAECDVLIVKNCGQIKETWDLVNGMGVNYLIMTDLNEEDKKKLLDMADMEAQAEIESLKLEKISLPEVMEVVILQQK